ncbi:PepSY domain-containing protein [Hyphomonas sp.]|uniref:PepSY domain-containing protein n=1 Tax=Hyphomonas sp. TaxID=87 RepID=UPI00391BD288
MKSMLAASLAAIMLAAPASLALADDDYRSSNISKAEALEIAEARGMVRLDEIELDDGEWEVEGCTAEGYEIEIDINARTGDVVKLEIDRDDRC